jgi:hypothetical protein
VSATCTRQLLLDLEAAGVDFDEASELADADDPVIRQIGEMAAADDRHHVMLAVRLQADIAQHDHLVVAVGLLEGLAQDLDRVVLVAGEEFFVGPDDPVGGLDEALTIGVVSGPLDERADSGFCFAPTRTALAHGFGLLRGSASLRFLEHRVPVDLGPVL